MQCRFSKARIIDTFFSGLGKNADRGRYVVGPGTENPRTCDGKCSDLRRKDGPGTVRYWTWDGTCPDLRRTDSRTKAGTDPARNRQKMQEMGRMLVKMIIFVV